MSRPRPQLYTFDEVFSLLASWQGNCCYTIFSIYAVQPQLFFHYFGTDVGPFLFANMMYGQAIHIFTRPAMTKLKMCFRILYSIHGSYVFNFTSLLIFAAVGRRYQERPLLGSFLSYCIGKFMYSLFYSFLYFVDKSVVPLDRSESVLDIMFDSDEE